MLTRPKTQTIAWFENKNLPIYIYGTGTFARDILNVLTAHKLKVGGFLDHLPRQAMIRELSVWSPDALSLETRSNSTVIIGIHNRDANIATIISRLKSLGFPKVVTPIDLYDEFAFNLGTRFWLVWRSFYTEHKQEIDGAFALLSDETSRDLYNQLIQFRITGDYAILPQPDLEHQYFPPDVPPWKTPLRFVDCGAFDGDTLKNFINAGIPIGSVAAFEPDQNNFQKLAQFVNDNKTILPNVSLWPCGVFSSTTQLAFETGQGMASNISNSGKTIIQCVSLDDAIPTFAPNLIKMDIEGAEYDALLGARELIATHTPGLAVSLYHRPEHLWQLPLLVERMAPGRYQFFMRSHALNDFELALYALPK